MQLLLVDWAFQELSLAIIVFDVGGNSFRGVVSEILPLHLTLGV